MRTNILAILAFAAGAAQAGVVAPREPLREMYDPYGESDHFHGKPEVAVVVDTFKNQGNKGKEVVDIVVDKFPKAKPVPCHSCYPERGHKCDHCSGHKLCAQCRDWQEPGCGHCKFLDAPKPLTCPCYHEPHKPCPCPVPEPKCESGECGRKSCKECGDEWAKPGCWHCKDHLPCDKPHCPKTTTKKPCPTTKTVIETKTRTKTSCPTPAPPPPTQAPPPPPPPPPPVSPPAPAPPAVTPPAVAPPAPAPPAPAPPAPAPPPPAPAPPAPAPPAPAPPAPAPPAPAHPAPAPPAPVPFFSGNQTGPAQPPRPPVVPVSSGSKTMLSMSGLVLAGVISFSLF